VEWLAIAAEDLDTATDLLRSKRYLYAGFEAQQAAEKALKAVIQEAGTGAPPKVNDLVKLAALAGLADTATVERLRLLSKYYVAALYPEERAKVAAMTDRGVAADLHRTAKEALGWATQRLTSPPS